VVNVLKNISRDNDRIGVAHKITAHRPASTFPNDDGEILVR